MNEAEGVSVCFFADFAIFYLFNYLYECCHYSRKRTNEETIPCVADARGYKYVGLSDVNFVAPKIFVKNSSP